MEGYPAPGAPAVIKVTSTGSGPKKLLRYAIPAGQKARMEMTMSTSMTMNIMGNPMPMDMPAMKMFIDMTVTNVAPNGDITYDIVFSKVEVDAAGGTSPIAAQAMQAVTDGMSGIKGTSTITSRGVATKTALEIADPTVKQLMPQMASQVENISTAFPEEAVGVGATWEIRQTVAGEQTSFTKTLIEVVSMDGQAVTLKMTSEQTAPPQSVSNPALPAGTEVSLEKLTGSGVGTSTVQLNSLVPTSSMESTTSTVMGVNMGGQSMPMTTESKIKITVAPVK